MNALSAFLLLWAVARSQPSFAPFWLEKGPLVWLTELSLPTEGSMAERLTLATEPLLGARYLLSPLGEGDPHGPDPDPRLRFDAFDCTTFVETALALATSPGPGSLEASLDRLRYRDSTPSFEARRHLPEAEWLPELIAMGVLRDVTRELGGASVLTLTRTPDPGRIAPGSHLPKGLSRERLARPVTLDVWPLAPLRKSLGQLRGGLVLSLVRADRADQPVLVAHQGLLVEQGGAIYLRHASVRPYAAVVDEPIAEFLARVSSWPRWPVLGVNLAEVRGPGLIQTS